MFKESERNKNPKELRTIIGGSTNPHIISTAIDAYLHELTHFAFPSFIPEMPLQSGYEHNIELAKPLIQKVIEEINTRAETLNSQTYKGLLHHDETLWNQQDSNIRGGIVVCVDKGIPPEAFGLTTSIGRTFAGDITITFSNIRKQFVPIESPTTKRMMHLSRTGTIIPEEEVEHLACGRRNQILGNESGHPDIPSTESVMKHLNALENEFPYDDENAKKEAIKIMLQVWNGYERKGVSVITPDGGAWVGIIGKIAQRQALRQLSPNILPVIKLYDKAHGDVFVGVDTIQALTHPVVLKEGGFTTHALEILTKEKQIFSFKQFVDDVTPILLKASGIQKGSAAYEDLYKNWLSNITSLTSLTQSLWERYSENDLTIKTMVDTYISFLFATTNTESLPKNDVKRWFIHQMFHSLSYAYLYDTLEKGHHPGVHHIEDHLAIGDHEIGTKEHLALGQGDVENPAKSEIFTGYTVLLHSEPGEKNLPVVVVIKLDTDRPAHQSLSTEETKIALSSFKEFLGLWPYFLVGDMIPIVAVRGKNHGGVDRLALSIILPSLDIPTLLDRERDALPPLTYALNSKGEVVYMPAESILEVAKNTGADLKKFRAQLPLAADTFSNADVQESFIQFMQKR